MPPIRYSIYSSDALEQALAERAPHGEAGLNPRSRSATIAAMCDRYAEICKRSLPTLALNEWLLIFDAMNGCWLLDHPVMIANSLAHAIHDHVTLNAAASQWQVTDPAALVATLAGLSFAGQIAVIDACERFWALDHRLSDAPPTAADPFAHWREPVARLLGLGSVRPLAHA